MTAITTRFIESRPLHATACRLHARRRSARTTCMQSYRHIGLNDPTNPLVARRNRAPGPRPADDPSLVHAAMRRSSLQCKNTVEAIIAGEPRRAALRNHSIYRTFPKELPNDVSVRTHLRAPGFRMR